MSGGTINPSHYTLTEMVDSIRENSSDPWHLAFASHLEKVAHAVRALDLELSSDTGPGDAAEAIRACLNDADLLAYQNASTGSPTL